VAPASPASLSAGPARSATPNPDERADRYRMRPAVATLDRVTEPEEPSPSGARTGLWVGLGLLLGLVGGILAGLLRSPRAAERESGASASGGSGG
jgi:hypothetical protein